MSVLCELCTVVFNWTPLTLSEFQSDPVLRKKTAVSKIKYCVVLKPHASKISFNRPKLGNNGLDGGMNKVCFKLLHSHLKSLMCNIYQKEVSQKAAKRFSSLAPVGCPQVGPTIRRRDGVCYHDEYFQVEGGRSRRMSVRAEAKTRSPSGSEMSLCGWLRRGGASTAFLQLPLLFDFSSNQVLPWDPILAWLWPKQLPLVQEQAG